MLESPMTSRDTENDIQSLLLSLSIISADSIEELYPKVRDREDVKVLRCAKSGVIFLSRVDHLDGAHYKAQNNYDYWTAANRQQALLECFADDARRSGQFADWVRGKKWLDVGTGVGGILDLLVQQAAEVRAVELQSAVRAELIRCGYQVYADLAEVPEGHFDVVTLFHVFEHLPDPLGALILISNKMMAGGKLIVEVPHAQDFLLSFLDLESFKEFTFWSEHLILHTRQSLTIFLEKAGFKNICIQSFQRYPLANHLHWLAKGKPGGHKHWHYLQTDDLDHAYAAMLAHLDKNDTLIAIAEK